MSHAITSAQALTIIQTAFATARSHNFKPMGVVVVDAGGQILAAGREDHASPLRIDIAHGKAAASSGMGTNSRALAVRTKEVPVFLGSIPASAGRPFLAQTGAAVILDANGHVLGAAGASGGTGDEDEQIVMAGIVAAGLRHAA